MKDDMDLKLNDLIKTVEVLNRIKKNCNPEFKDEDESIKAIDIAIHIMQQAINIITEVQLGSIKIDEDDKK